jgi:hypothetical protein
MELELQRKNNTPNDTRSAYSDGGGEYEDTMLAVKFPAAPRSAR